MWEAVKHIKNEEIIERLKSFGVKIDLPPNTLLEPKIDSDEQEFLKCLFFNPILALGFDQVFLDERARQNLSPFHNVKYIVTYDRMYACVWRTDFNWNFIDKFYYRIGCIHEYGQEIKIGRFEYQRVCKKCGYRTTTYD